MSLTPRTARLEDGPGPLDQYGSARCATGHFVVGGSRPSRLEDAVAEAGRGLRSTRDGA
jgi:hypothetical protein